ncbi:MAG: superoxide dismutase family protein [Casimicrobium sp.]
MTRFLITASATVTAVALIALAGCKSMSEEKKPIVAIAEMMPTTAAAAANLAATGTVTLTQLGTNRVLVKAEIRGLKPFSEHGFHIHTVPDCSGNAVGTGAHFNPDGNPHGDPSHVLRHAGAMLNIKTDAAGLGTTRQEVDTISLGSDKYSVIGLPIVTTRDRDDYVSQPLGNSGPRVSCGVIKLVPTATPK